jgi:hypothetical protein
MSRIIEKPDLFEPVVPSPRLDPRFVLVAEHPSQAPARAMARRVYAEHVDRDGNFVEQFQTTGFDQRTWELFLFAYLLDAGFAIDRTHNRPDFVSEKDSQAVVIEATTANPSGGEPAPTTLEGLRRSAAQSEEEILRRVQHEIPIRLGSPLYSKLGERYWELGHVAGKPLVFAIESFAAEDALYFSDTGLASYLYGLWASHSRTSTGRLVVTSTPVTEHRDRAKIIPSGFFSQPDSEHVSAVLFANTGTFPKFGRMAVQERLDSERVKMIRVGTCYDPDPDASEPLQFSYDVAERPEEWGFRETWGEGMSMYHNPDALHPIEESLFPDIAHHHLEDGGVTATVPRFHPFMSQTRTLHIRGQSSEGTAGRRAPS